MKRKYMADNKTIHDGRDNAKIDLNDPSEVEYVHRQFPNLEHAQVADAIKQYGPDREDVMEYLKTFIKPS